jgi:hypothetical protein
VYACSRGGFHIAVVSARKDKAVVLGELSFPSLAEATSKTLVAWVVLASVIT